MAVACSSRMRTFMAPMRSLRSAAYIAALRANSALPSRLSTSRIRSLSASTCGGHGREARLRVLPSGASTIVSRGSGSAAVSTTSFGSTTPRRRLSASAAQLGTLLGRVIVDLVEDQDDRLVRGGQLRQGRVLGLIQIGVGDEQDQVGPAGRVVRHRGPLRRRRPR